MLHYFLNRARKLILSYSKYAKSKVISYFIIFKSIRYIKIY